MHKTIKSRWGDCTYFLKDEYVGRSIHNYGEYGPDETEKILELAPKGKSCLDIGANIGVISMALLANGYRVHAFEPQPEVYKLLALNMQAVNGEFTHHNIALGSETSMVKMPKVYYSAKGNFGGLGIGQTSMYGTYDVPMDTLDFYNLNNVGFIKIDVEGFETQVLQGGRETILRNKPIMYIEDDRIDNRSMLRDTIKSLGYTYTSHQPTLYRENNFFGLKKNIWDRNYASHNLICVPV